MISLQDLINEGRQLSSYTFEKYMGIDCVSDEEHFFEWSSKSLMWLQKNSLAIVKRISLKSLY